MDKKFDKIKGCIYGLACGDALGATLEFMDYGLIRVNYGKAGLRDIVGGGSFKWKKGEYTDDTAMMKCLANSLIEKGKFDAKDIGQKYLEWKQSEPKDIGTTIRQALENFEKNKDPNRSGIANPTNGSLMRTAPIGIVSKEMNIEKYSRKDSGITHSHAASLDICSINNLIINKCINSGDRLNDIISLVLNGKFSAYKDVLLNDKEPKNVSGQVSQTFQAVLYSLIHNNNFENTIIQAVNFGGDTDTVGAIAGAIAGAYYGFDAILKRWVDAIKIYEDSMIENNPGDFVRLDEIVEGLYNIKGRL